MTWAAPGEVDASMRSIASPIVIHANLIGRTVFPLLSDFSGISTTEQLQCQPDDEVRDPVSRTARETCHGGEVGSATMLQPSSDAPASQVEDTPMPFFIRLIVNAVALWVATQIVTGVTYSGALLPFLGVAL